jgi:signal transduction histidine kinase
MLATLAPSLPPREAPVPPESAAPDLPPRILIVEDELIVATDVRCRLRGAGYEVVEVVADSAAALQSVRTHRPDLVLMDIGLRGGADGVATAHALREVADVPVIFVTGNSDEGTVRRAQAAHPYSYIVKPIRERELRISIDAALHHHRLARELRAARDELETRVRERTAQLERVNGLLQSKIADQLKLLRDLRFARVQALAASRSKSRFFANVGHAIRTPVDGIVATTNRLGGSSLTAEQRTAIGEIHDCGQALVATLDELIEFSDIEAGLVVLAAEPADLRQLLPEAIGAAEADARGREVELTCDIAPEVPMRVRTDPVRLSQIVRRLVALLIAQPGAREVEVQCECLEREADRAYLHFMVRDASPGFSPEVQRKLQRVFTQPDPAFDDLDGLGLGAAIPSLLVRRMEGILWVDTIPGVGNTLNAALWLPVAPAA